MVFIHNLAKCCFTWTNSSMQWKQFMTMTHLKIKFLIILFTNKGEELWKVKLKQSFWCTFCTVWANGKQTQSNTQIRFTWKVVKGPFLASFPTFSSFLYYCLDLNRGPLMSEQALYQLSYNHCPFLTVFSF